MLLLGETFYTRRQWMETSPPSLLCFTRNFILAFHLSVHHTQVLVKKLFAQLRLQRQ